ncbi:MAG: hypothetical protein U0359_05310 [Byssovorax sp.]
MAKQGERDDGRPTLGRVLGRSVTGTVNLVVAGSAAVGAAALHSLPILAVGGVAYAALVAWDLASPSFWKKSMSRAPEDLPDPEKVMDPQVGELIRGLVAGQEKLGDVLKETPEEVKAHLGAVMASMAEMEDGAARLIKRAEDLTRYLATTNAETVKKEIEKLAGKVSGSKDAAARKQYADARAAREEQLRALDDIAAARERLMANLTRMVATLEALPPKVVRMRALDAAAMDALSGTMNDELERINGDIKAFEETLQSLGENITA